MYNPDRIRSGITCNKILNKIIIFGTAESTNKYLAERNFPSGTIVLAKEQESGRGRHGKKWISEKGGLWFSYLINKKEKAPYNHIIFSSVAVVSVLKKYGIKAKIKWPNDILAGGRKICGMLVENNVYDGKVVTGVGLNVNNPPPSNTDIPSVSLCGLLKRKIDTEKLFLGLVKEIDKNLRSDKTKIISKWIKYMDDIAGREIKFIRCGKTVSGRIQKVNKDSSLIVDVNGKKEKLKSEIFFM